MAEDTAKQAIHRTTDTSVEYRALTVVTVRIKNSTSKIRLKSSLYKTPKNPKVTELSKSHRERSFALTDLIVVRDSAGKRHCVWCGEKELRHGNQKYCSSGCQNSALAWSYPQQEYGLNVLLFRQGWRCNLCGYDWMPLVDTVLASLAPYDRAEKAPLDQFNFALIRRLKSRVPKERRPEVDHIVPIFKGGQAIGLDNHQAICYTCHKTKTSKDLKKSLKSL